MMRPIIFSTDMVRAILDGRKTQTRRLLPIRYRLGYHDSFIRDEKHPDVWHPVLMGPALPGFRCPYGGPGDILYVRESFRVSSVTGSEPYTPEEIDIEYKAGGEQTKPFRHTGESRLSPNIFYPTPQGKWKPSIHMPKAFARLFLHVEDVRIEGLWKITLDDILREGAPNSDPFKWTINAEGDLEISKNAQKYLDWWKKTWDHINKKRGGGWDMDPQVFVVTFQIRKWSDE